MLAATLAVGAIAFTVLTHGVAIANGVAASAGDFLFRLVFGLLVGGLAIVGVLICVRRSGHVIGWLFVVSALFMAFSLGLLDILVAILPSGPPPWPIAVAAWLANWSFPVVLGILLFGVPLLFPTGHLPSGRIWRVTAALAILGLSCEVAALMFDPRPLVLTDTRSMPNPFGIPGSEPVLGVLRVLSSLGAPIVLLLTLLSLVSRYRHGSSIERAQLRWFLYPTGVALIAMAVALSGIAGPSDDGPWLIGMGALATVPPAIGVAILRHRLFDIDRIVSRTVTYAVVTAMLGVLYLALVLGLQALLGPMIGNESPLVVALSTLVVAGLFRPAMRRIQRPIDRRFNRSGYDLARTVDDFGLRLRSVTDLGSITDELLSTVAASMQPATASMWINGDRGRNDFGTAGHVR